MRRAHEQTMRCDLFVVLGSSLSVFPAADFPLRAKRTARRSSSSTAIRREIDDLADLVIHAGIGETMDRVLAGLEA